MSAFEDRLADVHLADSQGALFEHEVRCAASTGINVLIVGAGVGGLATALECHRKGHSVRIFERSVEAIAGGDMFTIGASGLKFLEHYPGMQREFEDVSAPDLWMRYRKWTGEDIGGVFQFGQGAPGAEKWQHMGRSPVTSQMRSLFHAMLYRQLKRFGIDVHFGMRVTDYFEDVQRGVGGVVLESGKRFEADLVIAADGLHSRSKSLVPGSENPPQPSGRTVFRGAFPLEVATADPLVKEYFGLRHDKSPLMQVWMGPDIHCVVMAYVDKKGQNGRLAMGIAVTESGAEKREESWYNAVTNEEVLTILDRLPGWGEAMKRLVQVAPPQSLIAWPLNPRNPNPTWHSPAARILQLGDAAHAFLPTSGNGATQAMEDAVVVAACLSHAGKDQVTTAVQVHNLLRRDRVSCAQLIGFANAQRFQKTDWDAVGDDASKVQPKVPKWLWSHHPERYTDENYGKVVASLLPGGPPFVNTNIPPGHKVQPWTIEAIEEAQRVGQQIELTGDWS